MGQDPGGSLLLGEPACLVSLTLEEADQSLVEVDPAVALRNIGLWRLGVEEILKRLRIVLSHGSALRLNAAGSGSIGWVLGRSLRSPELGAEDSVAGKQLRNSRGPILATAAIAIRLRTQQALIDAGVTSRFDAQGRQRVVGVTCSNAAFMASSSP